MSLVESSANGWIDEYIYRISHVRERRYSEGIYPPWSKTVRILPAAKESRRQPKKCSLISGRSPRAATDVQLPLSCGASRNGIICGTCA